MRKNGKRFRHGIQKAILTPDKELLYQKYREHFDGYLSPTLRHSLQDNTDNNIYNTWEVTVYDEDRLVACSFFDLGEKGLASILGIYDPEYAKFSLGYYTMLLEVEFGLGCDFDFYYPGYVVPNYPKFDYKIRIGKVDYYEAKNNEWLPFLGYEKHDIPVIILKDKLREVSSFLNRIQINSQKMIYPLYEANMLGYWQENFMEHPLFILCFPEREDYFFQVLTYDLRKEKYLVYQCAPSEELSVMFEKRDDWNPTQGEFDLMMDLIVKKRILFESDSVAEIAKAILPYRGQIF